MDWDSAAEESLRRVPRLLRGFVRGKVEQLAQKQGCRRVDAQTFESARRALKPGKKHSAESDIPVALIERLERETQEKHAQARSTRFYEVRVCGAAAGCPRSLVPVVELADRVVALIEESGLPQWLEGKQGPILSHHRFRVALSGCPNACSQPQIMDLGIIGQSAPVIDKSCCTLCNACVEACLEGTISLDDAGPVIDRSACLACGDCVRACDPGALAFGEPRYRLLAGGRLGRHPRLAEEVASFATQEQAEALVRAALALLMQGTPGDRLSTLLEAGGLSVLQEAGRRK